MKKVRTRLYLGVFTLFLVALIVPHIIAQTALRNASDINGDGKADPIVFGKDNKWYINYSIPSGPNPTPTPTPTPIPFGSFAQDVPAPGDYDGDGIGDIAYWRKYPTYVAPPGVQKGPEFHVRQSSSPGTPMETAWGLPTDDPVARDYDGDGKTDFAIVRRDKAANTMTWWILRSKTNTHVAVQFGYATDATSPGDYDGDGKFDISIQRMGATGASAATFYTLRSSDSNVDTVVWGQGDDRVVPGDYDGDGKTDYAVARDWNWVPLNQSITWIVRKSSDGTTLTWGFGLACHDQQWTCDPHLAQNDYDGDGKTDPAVWRTDADFFYLKSSTGYAGYGQVSIGSFGDYSVGSYDSH